MHKAPMWKRIPVVRHVRWLIQRYRVARWYALWAERGYYPVNAEEDEQMLRAIWRGDA